MVETSRMPFPDCVPELTDGVVRLRAHTPEDDPRIVEQATDPESITWTTVPSPYGPEQSQDFLRIIREGWESEGGSELWAIEEVARPGVFLGTIDLRPRRAGHAEVGYGLHPDGRERGVMSRALRLVAGHWFSRGGERVGWFAEEGNVASWRVAHACGFRWDGTLAAYLPKRGGGLANAWAASLGRDDPMRPATTWIEPPRLDLLGIALRPWRDEDHASVEVPRHPHHFMPIRAVPTPEGFARWLTGRRLRMSLGESVNWCIADGSTDRALGEVLVFAHEGGTLDEGDTAELGYQLFPSARGKGVTRTAARMAIRHAFTPREEGGLGLRRLVARTAADNVPSNRVLASVGFTCWGREPEVDRVEETDAETGEQTMRFEDALHWSLRRD